MVLADLCYNFSHVLEKYRRVRNKEIGKTILTHKTMWTLTALAVSSEDTGLMLYVYKPHI
jgi:hypothetical protein